LLRVVVTAELLTLQLPDAKEPDQVRDARHPGLREDVVHPRPRIGRGPLAGLHARAQDLDAQLQGLVRRPNSPLEIHLARVVEADGEQPEGATRRKLIRPLARASSDAEQEVAGDGKFARSGDVGLVKRLADRRQAAPATTQCNSDPLREWPQSICELHRRFVGGLHDAGPESRRPVSSASPSLRSAHATAATISGTALSRSAGIGRTRSA